MNLSRAIPCIFISKKIIDADNKSLFHEKISKNKILLSFQFSILELFQLITLIFLRKKVKQKLSKNLLCGKPIVFRVKIWLKLKLYTQIESIIVLIVQLFQLITLSILRKETK